MTSVFRAILFYAVLFILPHTCVAFEEEYSDEKDFLINFSLGAATNFGFRSFFEAQKSVGLEDPLEYRQELYFKKYALGECVSLLISYNKWDNVYFGGKLSYLHNASCEVITKSIDTYYNIKLQAISATLQAIYKAEIPEDKKIGGIFEGGIGMSFSRVKNSENVLYATNEITGDDVLLFKNEDPSYMVGICANFGFGLMYHVYLDVLSVGLKYEFDYLNIKREAFRKFDSSFKGEFVTPFIHKISLGIYLSF
ncbi:hypothetical protein Cyrtocomes_00780 [Candidatus Cyrtobacter comes]|uniref:Outer membrane protein beta-barrel domain-containing protein n=2 Tax=Candidatus Cyrtobacter comes TaxID=675776 RepID=A0ABU5L950_9RICK|nr:hypothetical protein [Candidatus Cyrtobacter comes]